MARPSVFTAKLGKRVCELISDGASLRSIGEMPTMPSRRTMRGWLETHPEFERNYETARRHRADRLVDEIIELSDSVAGSDSPAAVNAARLAVESRKWIAAKILPEYGDKLSVTGKDGAPLIQQEPPDQSKLALALLTVLRQGDRNDPSMLAPPPARATTLLSAADEPEPEPVPIKLDPEPTPAMRREHIRFLNVK